jgi:ABC-2 type transport system permease protein
MSRWRATARSVLAPTRVIARQLARDRSSLVFLVVLPIAIITIIGTVWGGADVLRLGVAAPADDPMAAAVVDDLEGAEGIEVVRYDDLEEVRAAVRRAVVSQGIVIDDGFGAALRRGDPAAVRYVVNPTSSDWFTVRATVDGVVQQLGVRATAARVVADLVGGGVEERLAQVDELAREASLAVVVTDVGEGRVRDLSDFTVIASQQLVLFVFVNSLGAATALVIARRSGVLRRAFASRTSLRVLLVGVMLAWLAVALAESVLIIAVGAIVFGVEWGDPLAAGVLVLLYAAVGAGAGLMLGTAGRNEDRVAAIGPATGMVLGALGGCMMPLELFPPPMLAVAHLTPHYWAVTAWHELVLDGEGLAGITPELVVLSLFALVLVGAATVGLRRELTGT